MITVKFRGQTGNQLTQYAFGRLLALGMNCKFTCQHSITAFPELSSAFSDGDGNELSRGTIHIKQDSSHKRVLYYSDLYHLHGFWITLEGYWELADNFYPHRHIIRSWFNYKPEPCAGKLAVHVRGLDGKHNSPPLDYYIKAIQQAGAEGQPFHVLTDDRHDPIVLELERMGGIVMSQAIRDDFDFMRLHDTIIIGNSTFAWWAAFLSSARRVIQPEPLRGFRSKHMPNSYMHVPYWEQIEY